MKANPVLNLSKQVPTIWDETKVPDAEVVNTLPLQEEKIMIGILERSQTVRRAIFLFL